MCTQLNYVVLSSSHSSLLLRNYFVPSNLASNLTSNWGSHFQHLKHELFCTKFSIHFIKHNIKKLLCYIYMHNILVGHWFVDVIWLSINTSSPLCLTSYNSNIKINIFLPQLAWQIETLEINMFQCAELWHW